MRPTASVPDMKSLLLFLPILHLAAAQSTLTGTNVVTVVSSVVPAATSIAASPSVFDPAHSTFIYETLPTSQSGVSVISAVSVFSAGGTDTAHPATTTIDFSVITANGTVVTLTPTGSVPPPVDTTVYTTTATHGSLTTSTRTTGTGTGSATGTQSLVASFTNAAPGADGGKFGLGFLGFAGAMVAVGL